VSIDQDNDSLGTFGEAVRMREHDTTVHTGTTQKQFTCWADVTVSISIFIVLHSDVFREQGRTYPQTVYANVSLDGSLKSSNTATVVSQGVTVRITQALTQGQHTLTVQAGGTGVVETRDIDIRNAYDLNPFSADTDSDGMKESEELTVGTDPCNPDTDNDGLADGQERYSTVYSTDEFIKIPDGGGSSNPGSASVIVRGVSGQMDKALAHVGIFHERVGNLYVKIRAPSGTTKGVHSSPGNTSANLFSTFDLIQKGFSTSEFVSNGTWTLLVQDNTTPYIGRIEYFKVEIDGRTDPLVSDSDGDGIADGEEVEMGVDGFVTNPRLKDTDGDGLNDWVETMGTNPTTLTKSDPTRNDTDDDSFLDNVDRNPTGDALVKLTIDGFWLDDKVDGGETANVFFTMKANGFHYATTRITADWHDWVHPSLTYYFEVWDSNDTVQFEFRAWDDDLSDVELDICNGASKSMSFGFNVRSDRWEDVWGTSLYSGNGTLDPYDTSVDGNVTIRVENVIKEKAHTVIVNSTDYGIYEVEDGYRYTADDQLYVFYLNCSSSSTHFVQGLNVVLLPRSIALESKINDTLWSLESIQPSNPLNGSSFYNTDNSTSSASGHIIAVISKNMTGAKADELLEMMTHNATNARIGNNVTIESTEILNMMHLPRDVLAYIPLLGVVNSPTGGIPQDFWGFLASTIVSIADFIWRGIVAVASFMIKLAIALGEICLKFVKSLIQSAASFIEAAVDAIVDAFLAFVKWIVEMVISIAEMIFSPIIDAINRLTEGFRNGVLRSLDKAQSDVETLGYVSSPTLGTLTSSLMGDLYWVLMGISMAIMLVLLAVKGMLGPFAFAISLFATGVCTVLVEAILGTFRAAENAPEPDDTSPNALERWLDDVLPPAFGTQSNEKLGLRVVTGLVGLIPLVCGLGRAVDSVGRSEFASNAKMFAVSFMACILGWSATMADSAVLGLFALVLSGASLAYTAFGLIKSGGGLSGKELPAASFLFGLTAFAMSLIAVGVE
jgi:subtilisin-like proprotein convertase family protein